MAELKISDYIDVDSIDGTELILVSKDGSYRKTTIEEIRNLASNIANTELADLLNKAASAQDVKNILTSINSQLSEKASQSELDSANIKVTNNTNDITNLKSSVSTNSSDISILNASVSSLASGAPTPVSLVSQMSNTAKNYVYTGTESGYIAGNWYYNNGSAWVSGGVYQSTGIADNSVTPFKTSFLTSYNEMNYATVNAGMTINVTTGELTANTNRIVNDLAVIENTDYFIGNFYPDFNYIWLLDSNKTPISKLLTSNSQINSMVTIPTGASYIRALMMSGYTNEIVKKENYDNYISGRIFGSEKIGLPAYQTKILPESTSKIDCSSYYTTGAIDFTGNISLHENYLSVYQYPVSAGDVITIFNDKDTQSGKRYVIYNSNKEIIFVSDSIHDMTAYSLTIPQNGAYVSFTIKSLYQNIAGDFVIHLNGLIDNINGFKFKSYSQIETVSEARNASLLGFLPSNDATTNTTNFQQILDNGGKIIVDVPGIYLIDNLLKIGSNTELIFSEGVYIKRTNGNGIFINKGAFTKIYDTDIKITGLNIICNGDDFIIAVNGIRALVAFFYAKNIQLTNIRCEDLGTLTFMTQWCRWENVIIDGIRATGKKDAVHVNSGKAMKVINGYFKTFDDPIALNAHDYPSCTPELGWIENVVIENCYDLADTDTTGYFARLLAGSWLSWSSGLSVRHSDIVVNNNKIYRVIMTNGNLTTYTSANAPTHSSGDVAYPDGITWRYIQDGAIYNCGCKNITFRDIYLQKNRETAISLHFDDDGYSRSYYPGSTAPVQSNILLDNVNCEANITYLIVDETPLDYMRVVNSNIIGYFYMALKAGIAWANKNTKMLLMGNNYQHTSDIALIQPVNGLTVDARILGSVKTNSSKVLGYTGVTFLENDIS